MNTHNGQSHFRFGIFFLLLLYHACAACESVEDHCSNQSVINFYEKRDLELFSSNTHENTGVFSVFLDRTITEFGKQQLREKLEHPITDKTVLLKRQSQIKYLVENPELITQLQSCLETIRTNQDSLRYFMFNTEDQITKKALEKFYFTSKYTERFNKHALMLDMRNWFKYLGLGTPVIEHMVLHIALDHVKHKTDKSRSSTDQGAKTAPIDSEEHADHDEQDEHCNCIGHIHAPHRASGLVKSLYGLIKLVHAGVHIYGITETIEQWSSEKKVINELYHKISQVKACFDAFKKISELTVNQKQISLPGDMQSMTQLFEQADIKKFMTSDNFDITKKLGFSSRIGQTLAHFKNLKNNRELLNTATKQIGELDALIALAQWFIQVNTQTKRACLVNFIESDNSQQPYIRSSHMWHIGLSTDKVVTNNLVLSKQEGTKLIITGPNGGGKSTLLKALGINIILAQSYGIAAAESMDMHIMHRLITNMIVTDGKNKSHMVAEILRAEECLRLLECRKKTEFTCVLIDDSLFTGTNRERTEQLAHQFIKDLGDYHNCCTLVATHMPIISHLAEEHPDKFVAKQMKMLYDEQKRAFSSFMLEPGIFDHTLAFEIIRSNAAQLYN
jgi:DNA mismatch repair ATPase MutS